MRSKWLMTVFGGLLLAILLAQCGGARQQTAATGADWPMYRRDLAGTGFSPLTHITAGNAATLTQVWTYSLEREEPAAGGSGPNSQATPIVVDDVMYLPAADRVVALEPATGREFWRHPVADGAPSRLGVAYWAGDDRTPPRIIFTAGRRLIALDAGTGAPVTSFGQAGEIDMVVPYNSVPLVYDNVVVVGANTPRGTVGGIGNARAFDARTGAKLWEFSSVPQPGAVGHDTWEGDSWRGRLGVNAWPFYFTMDEQRGLLYLPLASPLPFPYGGDRKGANLYGNSVVAVDIQTGEYQWHFQTIHHDLWDADPPAPPVLFDISRDGGTAPALGVTTKSGYLYILNRETGEPIFGVEERAVAESEVPGEQAFPTQPFPLKPPPLSRVSYEPGDLYVVNNRGNKQALAYFNFAPDSNNPLTAADAGDGFLMRLGYTIVDAGWQGNVAARNDRLVPKLPVATEADGRPIVAQVRVEYADATGFTLPLEGSPAFRAYVTDDTDTAHSTLTVRSTVGGARVPVAPDRWAFGRCPTGGASLVQTTTDICLFEGFQVDRIYELIYPAKDPLVMGLGYAVTRDIGSFLRYQTRDEVGNVNPLATSPTTVGIRRSYTFGGSSTGMYMRDFVYLGFNEDESHRKVFDGLWIHKPGTHRLFANVECSDPNTYSREDRWHDSLSRSYPPLTHAVTTDPISGIRDGLVRRPTTDPLVFQSDTSNEFWQMQASLYLTTGLGEPVQIPENVRLYLLSSFQHSGHRAAETFPGERGTCLNPTNPIYHGPTLRALLMALDAWADRGVKPP